MDPHKKSEHLRARATPIQTQHIAAHCARIKSSMGARILELLRQDIIAHHHFDLQIEVGPVRKPKARRAA